jgi:N-acetyl-gamma-glutamyl-phosphate reductase
MCIRDSASTVAYSGISGAGKKASVDLIFAENYNSVKAYNVGTHRHEVEIIQELKKYSEKIDYSLTTHLLPIFSGIYSTTVFFLKEKVYQDEVDQMFMNEYLGKEFIRIRENPPELKWVINTNYCDLNVKVVNNKVFVTAAIDNLIKGASGQAVQNMNKIFGWEESLGIKTKKEELQDV